MDITKIKDLEHYIDELLEDFRLKGEPVQASTIQINDLSVFRKKIVQISKIPGLFDVISGILNTELFKDEKDIVVVHESNYSLYISLVMKITETLRAISKLLQYYFPDEKEDYLHIKLPPTSDLQDLSLYSRDLHNAISQIVLLEEFGGKEEIVSVDNGSIWITISLGTGGSVAVIGAIYYAANVIMNFINKCRLAEEHLKDVQADVKLKQALVDYNIEAIKRATEIEAKFIQGEYFKNNEAEELQKIKNSITIFAQIIQKGGQVKPALNAPEGIAQNFPVVPELSQSKAIKQIENE